MKNEKINKDGTVRRKPSDNKVRKSVGKISFRGQRIEYNTVSKEWFLNGKSVGSLSNLSQALRPIVNDPLKFNDLHYWRILTRKRICVCKTIQGVIAKPCKLG